MVSLRLKGYRVKIFVNHFPCGMHHTFYLFREGNLNASLVYMMTFGGQLVYKSVFSVVSTPGHRRYGLLAWAGNPNHQPWIEVHVATGTSSDCAATPVIRRPTALFYTLLRSRNLHVEETRVLHACAIGKRFEVPLH